MITDEKQLNSITEKIIGAAYRVAGQLGCGFLEKCYENALAYELRKSGLNVQQQKHIDVWYEDIVVGDYVTDLIVNDSVLIELKSIESLTSVHLAQCTNYLAATRLPVCLLINFGKRVEVKRLAGAAMTRSE